MRRFGHVVAAPFRYLARTPPTQLGVVAVAVTALAGYALFQKAVISTTLTAGTDVKADFAEPYRLQPYVTEVKIAGVPVGKVTGVDKAEGAPGFIVTMKVNGGNGSRLGRSPSARIRPNTLLGGKVYVELVPGGERGTPSGTIPRHRTRLPVELDQVLESFDAGARAGVRTTVNQLAAALEGGGAASAGHLLEAAPAALTSATEVLTALDGKVAGDLAAAVTGLSRLARTLEADHPALESLVDSAAAMSTAVAGDGAALARTAGELSATLQTVRAGLGQVRDLLAEVDATAAPAAPVVAALDRLVEQLAPVLHQARQVTADLRPLLRDAAPLLGDLAPATASAGEVIDDLDGQVMARVLDPIVPKVLAPHRQPGPPLYQELAQMVTGLAGVAKVIDANGPTINFQPGVNHESAGGSPVANPLSRHDPAPGRADSAVAGPAPPSPVAVPVGEVAKVPSTAPPGQDRAPAPVQPGPVAAGPAGRPLEHRSPAPVAAATPSSPEAATPPALPEAAAAAGGDADWRFPVGLVTAVGLVLVTGPAVRRWRASRPGGRP
ncbi:MAG: MlaD family protein [Actinomycetota bacterium]|jgi:phospholipid/cholesterol/gamma-HCH transport system substrate-binding protein